MSGEKLMALISGISSLILGIINLTFESKFNLIAGVIATCVGLIVIKDSLVEV